MKTVIFLIVVLAGCNDVTPRPGCKPEWQFMRDCHAAQANYQLSVATEMCARRAAELGLCL